MPEVVDLLAGIDWRWAVASVLPLLTFWAGYRLGLRMKRTEEINALMAQLRPQVRDVAEGHRGRRPPEPLDADVLHRLCVQLGRWGGAGRLQAAADAYQQAAKQWQRDSLGQALLTDPPAMQARAAALLPLLLRRRI